MQQTKDMKKPCLKAFAAAFLCFIISIIPILIMSGGIYVSLGDYNYQSIVFSEYISNILHSGNGIPKLDLGTGLGMDFFTTYGGFLLSPFYLPLYIVPLSIVPYIRTIVVAASMGVTAVGAVLYTRQYLKTNRAAFICGMLYAFSGFQLFNLCYQFMDMIAIFPFLLYAFDRLVTQRKPIFFALLLALSGFINNIFLWEECIFIMIYFFVRVFTKSYPKITLKLFLMIAIESLFGVALSGLLLYPTALVTMDNPRAGNLIFDEGNNLIAYAESGALWHTFQSLFLPPETIRTGWYFYEDTVNLSNPALYIPLFSVVGTAAIFKKNKRSWYSVLLTVCAVIIFIPLFNSVFAMFNGTFYVRWTHMPLLVMILMTGMFLENIEQTPCDKEMKACGIILGFFILTGAYIVYFQNGQEDSLNHYWIMSAVTAAISLGIVYLLKHPNPKLPRLSMKNIAPIVCVMCTILFMERSLRIVECDMFSYIGDIKRIVWNNFESRDLDDDDEFYRLSNDHGSLNTVMNWQHPTIDLFNSMTPGNTCRFFNSAGLYWGQNGNLDLSDYPVRSFLSVKYYMYCNLPNVGVEVEPKDMEYQNKMEGFEDYTVHGNYIVYENKAFIPMGFTFDYYMNVDKINHINKKSDDEEKDSSSSENKKVISDIVIDNTAFSADAEVADYYEPQEKISIQDREKLLLKAIWLTEEQIEEYKDILEPLSDELIYDTSDETYHKDCEARKASACSSFVPDNEGFDAEITLEKPNLVFFSIPYSDGFTAYVDGEETKIEKVFGGLTAVYVPEGTHKIRYDYETPGLREGKIISIVSASVLTVHGFIAAFGGSKSQRKNKKKK